MRPLLLENAKYLIFGSGNARLRCRAAFSAPASRFRHGAASRHGKRGWHSLSGSFLEETPEMTVHAGRTGPAQSLLFPLGA